jgi:hypothetical protein
MVPICIDEERENACSHSCQYRSILIVLNEYQKRGEILEGYVGIGAGNERMEGMMR